MFKSVKGRQEHNHIKKKILRTLMLCEHLRFPDIHFMLLPIF